MKKFMALITAGLIMISSIPVLGAETKQSTTEKAPLTDQNVFDAIQYGVIPADWADHLDEKLTADALKELTTALQTKIATINGLKKQDKKADFKASEGLSQKAVLDALYVAISDYDYGFDNEVEKNQGVEYFKAINVVDQKITDETLGKDCTYKDAAYFAKAIIDKIFNGEDAASKGFFWKVQKGKNTVYMLGSIHLAESSIYPFSDEIMNAFNQADTLAVEADVTNTEALQKFYSLQMYSDGTTLKDHISTDLYEKITKATETLQGDMNAINSLKPWALGLAYSNAASTMSLDTNNSAEAGSLGIDSYLLNSAHLSNKKIAEVESVAFQGEMFDNFSPELQAYQLEESLNTVLEVYKNIQDSKAGKETAETKKAHDSSEDEAFITKCINFWKSGDAEKFTDLNNEIFKASEDKEHQKEIEEYFTKFYDERDKHMGETIENWLNAEGEHTYFVTVGSSHYVDRAGIIPYLTEKGFTVTPIK